MKTIAFVSSLLLCLSSLTSAQNAEKDETKVWRDATVSAFPYDVVYDNHDGCKVSAFAVIDQDEVRDVVAVEILASHGDSTAWLRVAPLATAPGNGHSYSSMERMRVKNSRTNTLGVSSWRAFRDLIGTQCAKMIGAIPDARVRIPALYGASKDK